MKYPRPHILLPTDVFPPRCGGAGWSAHTLALALLDRGYQVTAVVPQEHARGIVFEMVLGVPTVRLGYWAPHMPIARNYFRHELLWPRIAGALVDLALIAQGNAGARAETRSIGWPPVIIHAQHVQTAPAAVIAGRRLGVPAVVTVRDHWPWDYFATGLHGGQTPYHRQTWASLATDLTARRGPLRGALALPAIPGMLAHLRRRQAYLRQADAVVAVSEYVAQRLAGIVAPERLHTIPNMLDIAAIEAAIALPPACAPLDEPFLLFVGKLEHNKGAHLLIEIFRDFTRIANNRAWPLVIAGSGSLRGELERELAALGTPARFLDWIDHDETLRLMARCEVLLFPSAWGEPLSRVPLEAAACGAAILAMPTGGTPSIITNGVDGALEPTPARFARRLAALLEHPAERQALGAAARRTARARFAKEVVVERIEALYRDRQR